MANTTQKRSSKARKRGGAKKRASAAESTASRMVYVFWDGNNDAENDAKAYCTCVKNSPAVAAGCKVRCRLIDISQQPLDPIAEQFASGNTIEVVAVKDDTKVDSLMSPSFDCEDINDLVENLCD